MCIGTIRGYRILIAEISASEFRTDYSSTSSYAANSLDCCMAYSFTATAFTIGFGQTSQVHFFRTTPDLSGK